MNINIANPIDQTTIFSLILLSLVIVSVKEDKSGHEMLPSHANELKGIAILMVLFCHIGYFLFNDHNFLFPLSIAGGVGVDVFLVLSGFGLTTSALKKKLGIIDFYKKRLSTLYIPMWLVISVFLLLDYVVLHINYPLATVIKDYFGFFPHADLYSDLNSPLWYFSFIIFYYMVFPLFFYTKRPYLSAIAIYVISMLILNFKLPVNPDVQKLYELHAIGFPLGMLFAYILKSKLYVALKIKLQNININHGKLMRFAKYGAIGMAFYLFCHVTLHSGVGDGIQQERLTSIIAVFSLIVISLIIP